MPRFDSGQLRQLLEDLFTATDLPREDARVASGLLIRADLNGYPGHGAAHAVSDLSQIARGTIRVDQPPVVLREGKVTAVMDGNHYVGQVVAFRAMQRAIANAKEHGVGMVAVRRSGHVGRLAGYVEMALEEGMIGLAAASIGGTAVALHGMGEPFSGTNPMAFGFPGPDGQHILLDFATAVMSRSELGQMARKGEPIPEDIMLDKDGNPTTRYPDTGGPVVRAFGGHKGSGLAVVTELLGGLLSGNGPGHHWQAQGAAVNGLFFQAIAVEEFQPLDTFLDGVQELVEYARSRRPAPGFDEVTLPGERSRRTFERYSTEGVPVDDVTWEGLVQHARRLGVTALPGPLGTSSAAR